MPETRLRVQRSFARAVSGVCDSKNFCDSPRTLRSQNEWVPPIAVGSFPTIVGIPCEKCHCDLPIGA